MTNKFERIKNFNFSIKRKNNEILFMRTLKPGGSNHSFGIHVARMAGMPENVVKNAQELLQQLEASRSNDSNVIESKKLQLSFFDVEDPKMQEIRKIIEDLDIDNLSPVEALIKLNQIKKKIKNED